MVPKLLSMQNKIPNPITLTIVSVLTPRHASYMRTPTYSTVECAVENLQTVFVYFKSQSSMLQAVNAPMAIQQIESELPGTQEQ